MSTAPPLRVVGAPGAELVRNRLAAAGDVLVVLDPTAATLVPEVISNVLEGLAAADTVLLPPDTTPVTLPQVQQLADRCARHALVLAVGGGRVLDAAKIACSGAEYLQEQYGGAGGSRFLVATRRPTPLLVVPTTVGTGSEVSPKAMTATDVGRVLLVGDALVPDVCWVVPDVLRTLSPGALALGTLEIALRLLGPWLGSRQPPPEDVLELAEALAPALHTVLTGPPAAAGRASARLFDVSARAHEVAAHRGLPPLGHWLWAVATEWATLGGLAKMDAVRALLPDWSRWAADGEAGLRRPLDLLGELDASAQRLGRARSRGPQPHDLALVLDRVDRSWRPLGAGLPPRVVLDGVFAPVPFTRSPATTLLEHS